MAEDYAGWRATATSSAGSEHPWRAAVPVPADLEPAIAEPGSGIPDGGSEHRGTVDRLPEPVAEDVQLHTSAKVKATAERSIEVMYEWYLTSNQNDLVWIFIIYFIIMGVVQLGVFLISLLIGIWYAVREASL